MTAATLDTPTPDDPAAQPQRPSRREARRTTALVRGVTTSPDDRATGGRHIVRLIEGVLARLGDLGIAAPPGVRRALDLGEQTLTALRETETFAAWLARQDVTALSVDDLVDAIVRAEQRGHAAGEPADEIRAAFSDAALDELAAAADDLTAELRVQYDPAAAVLREAIAVGIDDYTTADQAIANDDQVEVWRRLAPAVRTLDEIAATWLHLIFVAGLPIGKGETATKGRTAWLRAAMSDQLGLPDPTTRTPPTTGQDRHGRDALPGPAAEIAADTLARHNAAAAARAGNPGPSASDRAQYELAQAALRSARAIPTIADLAPDGDLPDLPDLNDDLAPDGDR